MLLIDDVAQITIRGKYTHEGNTKVGDGVTVITRAAGPIDQNGTCYPSKWCENCYAMHGFFRRFRLQEKYQDGILKLPEDVCKYCRIHVSGDMDTVIYIQMLIAWVTRHPDTYFWGYTRSWTQPDLLPHLEILRALPNMQLFGSTDPTMSLPPEGWRIAGINLPEETRVKGLVCPYERCKNSCPRDCTGNTKKNAKRGLPPHERMLPDCKTCGYCILKTRGNVLFNTHSTS